MSVGTWKPIERDLLTFWNFEMIVRNSWRTGDTGSWWVDDFVQMAFDADDVTF